MKKILIPTDFSTQAEKALEVAAKLAKKHHYELHLLHVLDLPENDVDSLKNHSDIPEALYFMKLAQKRFEKLKSKPYLKGITIHESVEFKNIFKGIYHACEKNNIDLIVMGSNGASGFKEILIGSNTEKVVRTSDIPVLVIKKNHKNFDVKDFVFASDFKDESIKPFKKAIKLAKMLKANLHLLMVITPNKFVNTTKAKHKIRSFIDKVKLKNYSINTYNDSTIEKGIVNFSKSISADLIGISTHGRTGLSHFINGSISEDLVNHVKRPVITFKI